MGAPMIVFAVVDVESGRDEEVWAELAERLKAVKGDVSPLVMNRVLEQEDIALTLRVRDPRHLPAFLIENVRSIKGVRDIETFSLFEAKFLSPKGKVHRAAGGLAAFVFIATAPGRDREVYERLCALGAHDGVYPRFAALTFHKKGFVILLSLNAPSLEALEGYLVRRVRSVGGVLDTELLVGTRYEFLASPDEVYGIKG